MKNRKCVGREWLLVIHSNHWLELKIQIRTLETIYRITVLALFTGIGSMSLNGLGLDEVYKTLISVFFEGHRVIILHKEAKNS